jgi:acetyl esterase/lipase
MKAALLKPLLFLGNQLGQKFIFNRNQVEIGRQVRDLPYGEDAQQKLDVITPYLAGESQPVVVFFHGGGWLSGSKASYTRVCKKLTQSGALVINADYRLGPRHQYPAQLADAAAAIEWAYQNASHFGGDPQQIFIAGDSAGAHLASWVAAALNKPTLLEKTGVKLTMPAGALLGALLFFGVYDFETVLNTTFWNIRTMTHEGFLGVDEHVYKERARTASPIRHIQAGCAPLFICCGEVDPLFSESVALAQEAKAKGVPVEELFFGKEEYPEARHAFINIPFYSCTEQALLSACQFIQDHKFAA